MSRAPKKAPDPAWVRREFLRDARDCVQRARYFIALARDKSTLRRRGWREDAAISWALAVCHLVEAQYWRERARKGAGNGSG